MEIEQEQRTSKYNSAISALIRLNELWIDTHKHSRGGLFGHWNEDLDRIWLELARDLEEKQFKAKKITFDKFETQLRDAGGIKDSKGEGFSEVSDVEIKNRDKNYKILMDKELFLRRLENELGKGTAWEDGSEDDFD